MTPKQRDQLSGMAAVFAQWSLIDYVADLLAQARAEEREECAEVCEALHDASRAWLKPHVTPPASAYDCAAAIRARKEPA